MFSVKTNNLEYENKSLRLPKNLIQKVQHLADENNTSFNKVAIQCMEYALSHMEKKE